MPFILNGCPNSQWTIFRLVTILVAFGSLHCTIFKSHTSSKPDLSVPKGNIYLDNHTGKFLGNDGTSDSTWWLVNKESIDTIKAKYKVLTSSKAISRLEPLHQTAVHIDSDNIQKILQLMTDSTYLDTLEHQILIYLDLDSGTVSAVFGETGKNHGSGFEFGHSNGRNFLLHRPARLLIAQAHGHPIPLEKNMDLGHIASDSDKYVANCAQIAIYPIEADSMGSHVGTIIRILPLSLDSTQKAAKMGTTQGTSRESKTFNLGFDALLMWSKSNPADSACGRKSTHQAPITRSSP
jgi:hypothetical protein